jgi:1-phosphatidylinositol-4-phosphate 5-kinase
MAKEPNSLITKLVGLHAIRMYNLTIYMVVMQSVFRTPLSIHERYDLKGSWVDRWTPTQPVIRSYVEHYSQKDEIKSKRNRNTSTSDEDLYHQLEDVTTDRGISNLEENDILYQPIRAKRKGVLKDNDLNHVIILSVNDRKELLNQIRKDAVFLAKNNIMDYSLLLGIHHTRHIVGSSNGMTVSASHGTIEKRIVEAVHIPVPALLQDPNNFIATPKYTNATSDSHSMEIKDTLHTPYFDSQTYSSIFERDEGGVKAMVIEGPAVYFFGIIDILQDYNTKKKCERVFKIWIRCKDRFGISVVPPMEYARRFFRAIQSITVTGDRYVRDSLPVSPVPERRDIEDIEPSESINET